MWVIVAYYNTGIKMYEFDLEQEAREMMEKIQEYKILSKIIYFK